MIKEPLVSVIIPTHNRPHFLKKTILSIIAQTYKNLEIIIISNGVNEDNKRIVQEFNDPRLFYFDQKNTGSPASPRNHGIQKAKGKYIAFCDDDDLWLPEKIEKQTCILESNPDYGLCYTKMLRFDLEKKWHHPHESGPATLGSLLYTNTVPISSVVIRKSLINKFGGFLESKKIGTAEDYEFLLRYSAETQFYFLDEFLIMYWSGNNRQTLNNPSLSYLITQSGYIFSCYIVLWKSKRVKLSKLIRPSIHLIISYGKIILYQFFVKLGYKT